MTRSDGRQFDQLRPVTVQRGFTKHAAGSVLITAGETHVLCTASIEAGVPEWREGQDRGWVTAEYDMLPGATHNRRPRSRTRIDGRTQEIQRLIGRTLRSVVDMRKLGANTIIVDCDVLQADGGTRTASITGAFIALVDAVNFGLDHQLVGEYCIIDHVAAVSVGIIDNRVLLDLNYLEDVSAEVDMNVAMTGTGQFIELQGTGEQATFSRQALDDMVDLASRGIDELISIQQQVLNSTFK